jgi:hypothetical protein
MVHTNGVDTRGVRPALIFAVDADRGGDAGPRGAVTQSPRLDLGVGRSKIHADSPRAREAARALDADQRLVADSRRALVSPRWANSPLYRREGADACRPGPSFHFRFLPFNPTSYTNGAPRCVKRDLHASNLPSG